MRQPVVCPTRKEGQAQLEFAWRDARMLERELEEATGLRLRLTLTDNSSTVMSLKPARRGDPLALRLHHMFLAAGPQVVRALAAWLSHYRGGKIAADSPARKSSGVLDAFIKENRHLVRPRPRRAARLRWSGVHFNLRHLLEDLNGEYFGGSATPDITWGRMPPARRRRSIRFGSYSAEEHLIRINPLLDQGLVPEFFVRYIVFHEMLHAYLGIPEDATGRRRIHSAEFKRRERAFPDYGRALAWQNAPANLKNLLGVRRGHAPACRTARRRSPCRPAESRQALPTFERVV